MFKREIYRALIVVKWPKWQPLQPKNLQKINKGDFFFKFKHKTILHLNDIKNFYQKIAISKVETCLKKKPTPSTNIPILSYRKSEQLGDTKLHTISKIQTKLLVSARSPERSNCLFYGAVITGKKIECNKLN